MKITRQIEEQKALVEMLVQHKNDNEKLMDDFAKLNSNGLIIVEDPRTKLFNSMMYQMLKQFTIDLTFKIGTQKKTLREMTNYFETTYKEEFEKKSRVCNLNLDTMVDRAHKIVASGTPPAIADSLKDLLVKYNLEKDTIQQEDKNDLYDSLTSILKFAKNDTKIKKLV